MSCGSIFFLCTDIIVATSPCGKREGTTSRLSTVLYCTFFASPSQDKLSGIWGGCSFTFHTFHLRDPNCSRVFLALLILRKLGFHMKPFHQWPPICTICSNFSLSVDLMCTSGSGVGATFGFHQSPLSSVCCISLLWRRCFPLDFTGALFCSLLPTFTKWNLFELVANCMFLLKFWC